MRPWAWVAMLAVGGVGCGGAADQASGAATLLSVPDDPAATSAPPSPASTSPTVDTTLVSAPIDSSDPTAIDWMVPSVAPPGLRLIAAQRELVPGCGPSTDCAATVPSATLVYDTDDLSTGRSLRVVQTYPADVDTDVAVVPGGVERTIGGRAVTAVEQGDDAARTFIAVTWSETDGRVVEASSVGLAWDQLATFIESLQPTDPASWPTRVELPLERCVDARTQYAPLSIPDGWTRFVLQAAPTGTCGVTTFLMMSLVMPGTAAGPGTLITFVTGPASESTPQPGEPIDINGNHGTLRDERAPDGTATAAISIVIDAVAIDAHGNVDAEVLRELVAGVGPVTDVEWTQLVSEISTP